MEDSTSSFVVYYSVGVAIVAILFFLAGVGVDRAVRSEPRNPCVRTYEVDGHRVCVLDEKWGAFIR